MKGKRILYLAQRDNAHLMLVIMFAKVMTFIPDKCRFPWDKTYYLIINVHTYNNIYLKIKFSYSYVKGFR